MKLGAVAALLAVALAAMPSACAADWGAGKKQRTITGTVEDALGHPLAGVKLGLKSAAGKTVVRSTTDRAGKFYFRELAPGIYAILARRIGFKPATVIVPVTAANVRPVKISMESAQALNLPVIAARLNRASNSLSPETGSTVYRFGNKNINELPQGDNTPFNNVLIQAPGVSQDSYGQGQGQIHIHGFNGGGIQYRLNGIFLPEAVSSFGELFSPYFINSVSLIDNFMPAQFGYRNEGVVDIHTKDGCLEPGGRLEYYGGQRGTIQPSLTYGDVPET